MHPGCLNLIDKIPSEPRIPLGNYLKELVSGNDAKRSSIYLIGLEKYIQEIWDEIVKRHHRTLHVRSLIPRELGIHHMMFYDYKLGKKMIPIQTIYKLLFLWQKMCDKTDTEVSNQWEYIYKICTYFCSSRRSFTSLPKSIDPELSYLTGWICGDGNLVSYNNHYLLKISEKSTDQLNYILKPLLKSIFNLNAPIYHIYQGGFALQLNSKPLFRFLVQVLRLSVGQIPKFVYRLDDINLAYFLAGVFDSEGNVYKNRYKLAIAQARRDFLIEVRSLFLKLNIKFNGPTQHITKLGRWYTISLEKKSEIEKFSNTVGSYHINKSLRLKDLITKMRKGRKYI